MSFDLTSWLRRQTGFADLDVPVVDVSAVEPDDNREWLATNGLGSFASGSISGANTRRYHGLLVAALEPPVARTLLLSRIDERVNGVDLATNHWASEAIAPQGYKNIVAFAPYPVPTWVFKVDGGFVVKQVAMLPGKQEVAIGYSWVCDNPDKVAHLALNVLVNARDMHAETHAGDKLTFDQNVEGNRVEIINSRYCESLMLAFTDGNYGVDPAWYKGYYWLREYERGLATGEDLFRSGVLHVSLKPGESVSLRAGLDDENVRPADIKEAVAAVVSHQSKLLQQAGNPTKSDIRQLVIAADQFIVHRDSVDSASVIAGYHWFNDWGRDSMISLLGLTLAAGRYEIARSILSTFKRYLSEGMLPNNFPDAGAKPDYNTVDATLLWGWAMHRYYKVTGDLEFVKSCLPDMDSVVEWHLKGTRYNIHVDKDGLVSGSAPNVQLTWMDAKCGDLVVTPRGGKPVEISALWYNFLLTLADLHKAAGEDGSKYRDLAEQTQKGFSKFWNTRGGNLYDCIAENGEKDASVRPNQLFAISLPHALVSGRRAESILWVVENELLTPMGLRSLSPNDPKYIGQYGCGRASANQYYRDITYHQGTVWSWLIGIWVDARIKTYGKTAENIAYIKTRLAPLRRHLQESACLGSVSEIFDGDRPFKPQGCIAQAWGVAELLRVLIDYPELQ